MLFTITYTGQNTQELGFLLYKNPARPQVSELSHGKAYVFYPEVSDERTTAALLLDIDPLDLARGKAGSSGGGLFDYVNDRPYASSSFMSTAISKVFGTAMTGRADAHQKLSDAPLDLTASVAMLPCRGEREKLNAVFEPLGYEVSFDTALSDEKHPNWGESKYVNLTLKGNVRLRDLLRHVYVLIPVFDRQKHYWVGTDEVEKLLQHGEGWLENHPEKEYITRRYLGRRRGLVNLAFERLAEANVADGEAAPEEPAEPEEIPEKKLNLNAQRLGSVIAAVKSCGAKGVIDLGCGEGNLLNLLMKERQFSRIAGMDVSHVALGRANDKLKLEHAGEHMRERMTLFQGSLTYKDTRIAGYDAACVVEVIEHLDPPRLAAFERVLFEFAKPPTVILTTPNKEYNANYANLHEDDLRHGDHRFEWTRAEFRDWANKTAEKSGYTVRFSEIGDADEKCGAPTQMGVFSLCE
ncbi:MAG: 3' terminal RNA ribose 2'-O-methyltransferase Hen1 [Clostridiales Family XIII bacterium]|nr:3' terminal RNA ribose 2'-O-methyltransferase Hen1 [Clostridiales Family XIII bacterium]